MKFIQDDVKRKVSLSQNGYGELGYSIIPYKGKFVVAYLPSRKSNNTKSNLDHDTVLNEFIDFYFKKLRRKYFDDFSTKLKNTKNLKDDIGFMSNDEIIKASFIASLGYLTILNKSSDYDESVFIFEPENMKKIDKVKEKEVIDTILSKDINDLSISAIIKVPNIANVLTSKENNINYKELDEYIKKPTYKR